MPPFVEDLGHIVPGLFLIRGLLEGPCELSRIEALCGEALEETPHSPSEPAINQRVQFGEVPEWVGEVSRKAEAALTDAFLQDETGRIEELLSMVFDSNQTYFDCFIVNRYAIGEGIKPHIDLLRYKDGILGLSLKSSSVLRLEKVGAEFLPIKSGMEQNLVRGRHFGTEPGISEIPLHPGDLYILSKDARYNVVHSIDPCERERISLTLRKLKKC